MDALWQKINEAIHSRRTDEVAGLIHKYLKLHKSSPDSVYEASEFFRKISDHKNALRILPRERQRSSLTIPSEIETKLELQLARLLNVLGASNYALRMVDKLRAENRVKSKIEMVEIYHSNYRYADVVDLLGENYPIPKSEPWHQDWLLHFYLSFALAETNKIRLAIQRVEKVREVSASPLIHAMTYSYQGKYLLMEGQAKQALTLLTKSLEFFKDIDHTSDHAILLTFLGECYLELQKFPEAESAFEKALKILFQPGIKLEEWIEIPLMMERIPGKTKPALRLAPRLRSLFGADYAPLTKVDPSHVDANIFSIAKIEPAKKIRHIDRASDMAWDGKVARLGLDLIDELIWNLLYAGKYGLPQFHLYELLWPDEPFAFDQHQKRLEQVVNRARKRGFKISWDGQHLYLLSKDVSVSERPEKVIRGHSFLLEHAVFTRRDIECYFSTSSTTAQLLCRDWIRSGLVTAVSKSQYRSLTSRKI